MMITAYYKFTEGYLPTARCRILRFRDADATTEVEVNEVTEQQAPIALQVHKSFWDIESTDIVSDYRYYNDKLYKIVQYGDKVSGAKGLYPLDEFIHSVELYGKYNVYRYGETRTKEYVVNEIQSHAAQYIIINNNVWVETGEPRYVVNTFGLGHNHGGTGMFIENHYNSNISKNNYFNSLEREKAIGYANMVAERRGDTKDIGRLGNDINIVVLIPEVIRCNPQIQHGEGDEFHNTLERMIEKTDSAAEAGFLTMAMTLKEISR